MFESTRYRTVSLKLSGHNTVYTAKKSAIETKSIQMIGKIVNITVHYLRTLEKCPEVRI